MFCEFLENVAYLVIQRPDGIHLEKVRFRPNLTDTGLDYFTHIDRRMDSSQFTQTYDAINNETVVTLPANARGDYEIVTVKSQSNLHAPGVKLPIASVLNNEIRVAGNVAAWDFVVGLPYKARFTLTRPYATQQAQNGTMSNTEAIIKVRDYSLDYTGTGYFDAIFSPKFRQPYNKVFSGSILGASPTDIPEMDEGTFRIKTPTRNTYWSLSIENN